MRNKTIAGDMDEQEQINYPDKESYCYNSLQAKKTGAQVVALIERNCYLSPN